MAAYEQAIANRRFRPVAMSVLASGAIPAREAVAYVCSQPGIESIVFGPRKPRTSATKGLIDELERGARRVKQICHRLGGEFALARLDAAQWAMRCTSSRRRSRPAGSSHCYFAQAWRTLASLRERPDVVWFQQPPNFLAHFAGRLGAAGLRFQAGGRLPQCCFAPTVVALSGHGMGAGTDGPRAWCTTPRWRSPPAGSGSMGRLRLLETRRQRSPSRVRRDARRDRRRADRAGALVVCDGRATGCPAAGGRHAARTALRRDRPLGPRLPRAKGFVERAPANVRFTDYLALDEFNGLLLGCDLVLGLTTIEGIQLSVANEAIGAGKPLVLSDTTILRELFGAAGMFTPNEAEAIWASSAKRLAGSTRWLRAPPRVAREMRERAGRRKPASRAKGRDQRAPTATASGPAGSPTAGHQQMPS
ncbi:MAG: hypothetical protein R3E70_15550 [Burkholderiaceae bacterium]